MINLLRDLDAARKTQTGLANCDSSLFSLRRDGKRKTLGQSDILSSELEVYPATCLVDFITKCNRISRSHASTKRRCSNISLSRDSDIRYSQPRSGPTLLSTAAIAVVPQNQTFRRRLPQTNWASMSWNPAHESRSQDSKCADRPDSDSTITAHLLIRPGRASGSTHVS
jgi:hypothetical protein